MKFDTGVKRVDNVFDEKAYNLINTESCSLLDSPDTAYQVNKSNWTALVPHISGYGQAGTILTTEVGETVKKFIMAAVQENCEFAFNHEKSTLRHTYMFRGAYIPWHNDTHCDVAVTYYLQDWHPDNGGLYLWSDVEVEEHDDFTKNPRNIQAVCPQRNTLLLQHHVIHSVSALTPATPVRRSIQAFLSFAK